VTQLQDVVKDIYFSSFASPLISATTLQSQWEQWITAPPTNWRDLDFSLFKRKQKKTLKPFM
jgi:hypothetical protein